jgi:hypothetical protein
MVHTIELSSPGSQRTTGGRLGYRVPKITRRETQYAGQGQDSSCFALGNRCYGRTWRM